MVSRNKGMMSRNEKGPRSSRSRTLPCALTGSNRGPADYGLGLDLTELVNGDLASSLPAFDNLADLTEHWGNHYCKFCGEGFATTSARHAHELTCRPWERADEALRMWAVAR